jgi:quercetin dioxygenase-like cupin family protein
MIGGTASQFSGERRPGEESITMQPFVVHQFGGSVYAKETHIPAGMALIQHRHKYDHLSYLVSGRVLLDVDGERTEHTAPAAVTIRAHKHHGVKALTDVIWLCIHAVECCDGEDPEKIDEGLAEDPTEDMLAHARALQEWK